MYLIDFFSFLDFKPRKSHVRDKYMYCFTVISVLETLFLYLTFNGLVQEGLNVLSVGGDHTLGKHKLSLHLREVGPQQLPPPPEGDNSYLLY